MKKYAVIGFAQAHVTYPSFPKTPRSTANPTNQMVAFSIPTGNPKILLLTIIYGVSNFCDKPTIHTKLFPTYCRNVFWCDLSKFLLRIKYICDNPPWRLYSLSFNMKHHELCLLGLGMVLQFCPGDPCACVHGASWALPAVVGVVRGGQTSGRRRHIRVAGIGALPVCRRFQNSLFIIIKNHLFFCREEITYSVSPNCDGVIFGNNPHRFAVHLFVGEMLQFFSRAMGWYFLMVF